MSKYMSIEESRALSLSAARRMNNIPAGVQVTRFEIDHMPAAWVIPDGAIQNKVVLHFHGGGYVLGGIESSQMMAIVMAQTLKMKTLLTEYRLAPEHPFPAAVEDGARAYRWLVAQGVRPQDITISGDSAGGGLSLAALMMLRDAGDALPSAAVCMSPWADLSFSGESHISKQKKEVVLRADMLRMWAAAYCGAARPDHPLVSPVYGGFFNFPPILIQVGSDEVLLDDALMLAKKAKADGADVTLKIWHGMWHVWQALGAALPESRQAFEEMGAFLRSYDNRH